MMIGRISAKNHAHKVGPGEARDTTLTGEFRSQGVSKFIQGSGAVDSIVWARNVGPLGVNGKEDRGNAHGVSANDHGEESETIRIWDMGEAGRRRHAGGIENPVG